MLNLRTVFGFVAEAAQDGQKVWYIVKVPKERSLEFMMAINKPSPNVNLNDYGEILASGIGDEIPQPLLDHYVDGTPL
jgi:hypothetical protein